MSVTVNVNGVAISYPITGDVEWGDEATEFAIQVGSVLQKIGQGNQTPTTDNIAISPGNLTVTSGNLSVGGNTTLTGNLTANGNTTLGNATSDTIAVTGILNVDSGTLYVNPTDNRVGINDSTPSEALDVTGNALISGTLGVTGDLITSIVKASGSGGLTIDSNSGTDVALFGAGGGSGTTLYGGLNGTSATFSSIISNSDGTVSAPSITFTNDTNTGFYRIGSDIIGIAVNGSKIAQLDFNGITANLPYWIIVDQKTNGTNGGSFTSGAWRTRDLNTTIGSNTITGSSLASNQFTLPSGTYYINSSAPGFGVNQHKIKLRNITDSSDVIIGSSENTGSSQTRSFLNGTFTISSSKVFEIQHYGNTTSNTNGFGSASSFSVVEIYTQVELRKLA
jgi:hypothetical protein